MPLCVEESFLSFHCVDSRDQIQILGLGSKCIYLLSYFISGSPPRHIPRNFLAKSPVSTSHDLLFFLTDNLLGDCSLAFFMVLQ